LTEGLFSGLKVLDVGTWIAGPVAGTILADYGADVIKVEMPEEGDRYRVLSDLPPYPDADSNYMWQIDARNKRSLSLNLRTPEGIRILHQMIADCDVYITNQPFPVRDAFNLNYDDLKEMNPRMIYASLTAYGEKGPERDKEGFDLVAYWARSGLMDLVRVPDAMPSQAMPGMGDHPSAVTLYASIVTALLNREKTGKGTQVHTSLLANGLWAASCMAQAGFANGNYDNFRALRESRRFGSTVYETSDGRYFQMTMIRTDGLMEAFLACIGIPELLLDEKFDTAESRFANASEFSTHIQNVIAQQDAASWHRLFEENDIPAVLVELIESVVDDQQIKDNAMVDVDAAGTGKLVRHPLNVDGLHRTPAQDGPEIGEHNEDILVSLGYNLDEIKELKQKGII
jgi:crotonobetainyl-CoA:carnitine CoA-transferase CaiB-like acyl-CoA transferase